MKILDQVKFSRTHRELDDMKITAVSRYKSGIATARETKEILRAIYAQRNWV